MTQEEIIEKLQLIPHPEGGYYRETYRSESLIPESALPQYSGSRNTSTAIYFMLTAESYSAFHRVQQDELWHFHLGDSIELHSISPEGHYSTVLIGNDLRGGAVPQHAVPGGHWFAAKVIQGGAFSLVSCTVAPGFDFLDFELANDDLARQFPQHAVLIRQYLPTED